MKKCIYVIIIILYSCTVSAQDKDTLGNLIKFEGKINPELGFGYKGLKDKTGKIIFAASYIRIDIYDDHAFLLDKKEHFWLIDKTGKIKGNYDNVVPLNNGLYGFESFASKEKKIGLIDKNGKTIVPLSTYENINEFQSGYAVVKKNNKVGLIDSLGNIIVKPIYDNIRHPSDGMIEIKSSLAWGYVNMKGEEIIYPKFAKTSPFYNGYAIVCYKLNCSKSHDVSNYYKIEEHYKIDKTGKQIN